jgi:CheY-like chemotaxis protein
MTIIYVEDDPEDQEFFRDAITIIAPHTTCYFAGSCNEAFRIMKKIVVPPDYIFLDINMPEMNGKEFLKVLKGTPGLKSIPVVVYSTSNSRTDMEDCRNLGAVDFIVKPNDFSTICETLKRYL